MNLRLRPRHGSLGSNLLDQESFEVFPLNICFIIFICLKLQRRVERVVSPTDDTVVFVYIRTLIAELSRNSFVGQKHPPSVTRLYKNQLPFSFCRTHTHTHSQLCSIMSPSLTAPEKISLSLSCHRPRSAFLFFRAASPPFNSPSLSFLFFSFSPSVSPARPLVSPRQTMSCNNTELNLRIKAVFPLRRTHVHFHSAVAVFLLPSKSISVVFNSSMRLAG